ncbi:hypothetical protein BZL41_13230 [Pseudomonas sp. PIC25]|uniref:hypothetical protein n=1 Tax=Pseudomonas sp. PIC25 TaxID=1958773 RepID=UPI000BAB4C4F|nr:hypothetical protein [Pseudomonas sp. PIC25]PAU62543.1 hypothetical protein BZL41_13230 [Pseudomonas sp. PIC25]
MHLPTRRYVVCSGLFVRFCDAHNEHFAAAQFSPPNRRILIHRTDPARPVRWWVVEVTAKQEQLIQGLPPADRLDFIQNLSGCMALCEM